MRFIAQFWLVACTFVVGLSSPGFAQDNANKPLVTLAGADSRIEKSGYELITSKKDWTNLWLRHTGKPVEKEYDDFYNPAGVPEINFEKCMVIAVFSGAIKNVAAVEAVTYTDAGEEIRLQFKRRAYQTGGPDGSAQRATPYGLFVVSRSAKPLILERDVQNIIGQPPDWKEVARFPKR
jgi:hypothetical protein